MSHVSHIVRNKKYLEARALIIRAIREFFWSQEFLEMETPIILALPGQEPYLTPMKIAIHNERGETYQGYLHTSPEYAMKKLLAAGFPKIFSICKTFRDYESFGGTHNPEFTMIEWYRTNATIFDLMSDIEELFRFILGRIQNKTFDLDLRFERLHMREAWKKYAGVNLDEYLDRDAMFELCVKKGYAPKSTEPFDDLFYRIFLNEIEPHLGEHGVTFLHHYPLCMAALSKVSVTEPQYAERIEAYAGGLELANGFTELTDADEQLYRLKVEQEFRKETGKEVFPIDLEFIEAVRVMPSAAGIALGIDRLVQLFTGCKNIDDVLVLPASLLFDSSEPKVNSH